MSKRVYPPPAIREALKPFATTYALMLAGVRELPDGQLRLLADATKHFKTDNCWWAEYAVVVDVAGEAKWTLDHRVEEAAKARSAEEKAKA